MPTVYLKYKYNPKSKLMLSQRYEYYLKLIIKQTLMCLNSNCISYIEANKNPSNKTKSPKIKIDASIVLTVDSHQEATPYRQSGICIFFIPGNPKSKRLAQIMKDNLRNIYSPHSNVTLHPIKNSQIEIIDENQAKVTLSLGYVDSKNDFIWLKENTEEISQNIIMSLTQYFGLPFAMCMKPVSGFSKFDTNIFAKPSLKSNVLGFIPQNKKIQISGQWEDWYIVGKNYNLGYVPCKFIEII